MKIILFLLVGFFPLCMLKKHFKQEFYGTTTLGEKGQVVIPAEARSALQLKKGDKLLVFGMNGEMLAFGKISDLQKFAAHMAKHLEELQTVLQKSQKKN